MFQMKIDTDNAAFEDSPGAEVARILRGVADKLDSPEGDDGFHSVFDVNGNRVGTWELVTRAWVTKDRYRS